MRDPRRQHPGLADAGAGEHQHGAVERLDRRELLGVEAAEIGRDAADCAAETLARRLGRREGLGVGMVGSGRHGTNHAPPT